MTSLMREWDNSAFTFTEYIYNLLFVQCNANSVSNLLFVGQCNLLFVGQCKSGSEILTNQEVKYSQIRK